jgi:hypothetical protein
MMGSDMPFPIGDEESAKIVAAAALKADAIASITGGLAQDYSGSHEQSYDQRDYLSALPTAWVYMTI